jgi:hypothetical protein
MRRIALVLAVVALAACNDSTSPNGSAQGTYSVRTVNGNSLPYTFPDGSVLVSDQLTLNSNGSYVDVAQFSNASNITEQGSWSINNNLVSFFPFNSQSYTGSLSGNVLTETFPLNTGGSITEVYQKD